MDDFFFVLFPGELFGVSVSETTRLRRYPSHSFGGGPVKNYVLHLLLVR